MKKRVLSLLFILSLLVGALSGCSFLVSGERNDTVRIGALTGPTAIGLAKVMADNEGGTAANAYGFTVAASADVLTPKLIQGELDIAAVPANLASVLYARTKGEIQMLAVNTLGVLYIVEKGGESVQSLSDLSGKTVYATGKGSVTEYNLRYLLSEYGINPDTDLQIEWKSEPNEVVAALRLNESGIAMLPQPYVTVAQGAVSGLRTVLDLTAEWDALGNGSQMITGTLVVRTAYAASHPEKINAFLTEYEASVRYVNAHAQEASAWVENYIGIKAAVAQQAIPFCNLTYLAGNDMKAPLEKYLQILFEQNPAAVGGAIPGEDFYYGVSKNS